MFHPRWEIKWFLETKRFSHFGHWHSPPEAAGIDVFVTTGRNVFLPPREPTGRNIAIVASARAGGTDQAQTSDRPLLSLQRWTGSFTEVEIALD